MRFHLFCKVYPIVIILYAITILLGVTRKTITTLGSKFSGDKPKLLKIKVNLTLSGSHSDKPAH